VAVLYGLSRAFGLPRGQQSLFAYMLSQGGEFAFVVFGAAATAKVFSPDTASILALVVALSMVTTPILLMLHDRVIAPRFRSEKKRPADKIPPNDGHVIIAGFGRVGQIVGRLLNANAIKLTILDHDPDQVDVLRRFGFDVFYGDATRLDLLHAAGAAKARALVLAIDDVDDSLAVADAVRAEFPDLPILARARNVTHYYELMDRGVEIIERETFDSALLLGRRVLAQLGYGAYQARQASLKFRQHNLASLLQVYPFYKDRKQYVSMAKQARDELNEMFARDRDARKAEVEAQRDWD
jgi:glutathione-regulated potassium-efflux system ancillary protein KefC